MTYQSEKRCCTVCDQRKKCHVCGEQTLLACADCRMNFGATVYVCGKRTCRDIHEVKCYGTGESDDRRSKAIADARLRWLANTVLFCDYGDNPQKQIGWRVYEFIAPLMYGQSIIEAIDAARAAEEARQRRKSLPSTVGEQ